MKEHTYTDHNGAFTPEGAAKYLSDGKKAVKYMSPKRPDPSHLNTGQLLSVRGNQLLVCPMGVTQPQFTVPCAHVRPWTAGEERFKPKAGQGLLDLALAVSAPRIDPKRASSLAKAQAAVQAANALPLAPTPPRGTVDGPEEFPGEDPAPKPLPEPPKVVKLPEPPKPAAPVKAEAETTVWVVLDRRTLELWHGGTASLWKSNIEGAETYTQTTMAHRALENLVVRHPKRELYVVTRERAMDLLTDPNANPAPSAPAPAPVNGGPVTLEAIKADLAAANADVETAKKRVEQAQVDLQASEERRQVVRDKHAKLVSELMALVGITP